MDDDTRRTRGNANRRAVLGDAYVDRASAAATPFTADFQDFITRYAWGEIWDRPGLDHETRRLLVIAMTIALGREGELRLHLRAAFEAGVSVERVKETILQSAVYCGVPAANAAFHAATDVLRDLGRL